MASEVIEAKDILGESFVSRHFTSPSDLATALSHSIFILVHEQRVMSLLAPEVRRHTIVNATDNPFRAAEWIMKQLADPRRVDLQHQILRFIQGESWATYCLKGLASTTLADRSQVRARARSGDSEEPPPDANVARGLDLLPPTLQRLRDDTGFDKAAILSDEQATIYTVPGHHEYARSAGEDAQQAEGTGFVRRYFASASFAMASSEYFCLPCG